MTRQPDNNKAVWVLCCGMRRGGSTLQYQLASQVAALHGGKSIGVTSPEVFEGQYAQYSCEEKLVVIKCHQAVPALESLCQVGEVKVLYV